MTYLLSPEWYRGLLNQPKASHMTLTNNVSTEAFQAAYVEIFLNVSQVIERLPMGRSTWLEGVKAGKYPAPVRLSPQRPVWKKSVIDALVDEI